MNERYKEVPINGTVEKRKAYLYYGEEEKSRFDSCGYILVMEYSAHNIIVNYETNFDRPLYWLFGTTASPIAYYVG